MTTIFTAFLMLLRCCGFHTNNTVPLVTCHDVGQAELGRPAHGLQHSEGAEKRVLLTQSS